jgi:hypothetical protein
MELEKIEIGKSEELRVIQTLRAEIAYLENPARLADIAQSKTDLRPSTPRQILSAREFAAVYGDEPETPENLAPPSNVIFNAMAMALNVDVE